MSLDTLVQALNNLLPIEAVSADSLIRLVKAHGLGLTPRSPRDHRPMAVAPGQVAAFTWVPLHCTRCGRELKHPHYLDGAPFGRDCIRLEGAGL